MLRILGLTMLLGVSARQLQAQTASSDVDAFYIRKIYDRALTTGACYDWLGYLTQHIGARLAGSPQAAAAVNYTHWVLDTLGLDTVWLQPCMVNHWVRGDKEVVRIVNSPALGSLDLHALSLGNAVGTGPDGLTAEVVEVQGLDDLEKLGRSKLEGKIVFFNRPFDPTQINTFAAYGGAVDQRGSGAARAARFGAVAVLVRSMTTRLDDVPHTGSLAYEAGTRPIPAVAISTNDAEMLSWALKKNPTSVYLRTTCQMLEKVPSFSVIGEIRGTEHPEDIILVGGHLDSWDVGQGAHDDGAGCVQSMEVLRLLRQLGYKPSRTLRCVLFMNEENGLAGGRAYWEASNAAKEFHLAAIESDRGGFTPRGFTFEADAMMRARAMVRTKSIGSIFSTFSSGVPGMAINMLIGTLSGCSSRLASVTSMPTRSSAPSPMPMIPPEQTLMPAWRTRASVSRRSA